MNRAEQHEAEQRMNMRDIRGYLQDNLAAIPSNQVAVPLTLSRDRVLEIIMALDIALAATAPPA